MDVSPAIADFKFRAFIAYSHQDEVWAKWLHKALETYRVPSRLVGTETPVGAIPRRLAPIFRDRSELPSASDLDQKVNEALDQSANLIVICSPRSATSHYVNEEIITFKRLAKADRIFCLIVDGEPNATDQAGREAEECFAPALRFAFSADGRPTQKRAAPIAADARQGRDGKTNAKLKLIAGMLDIGFDALKQREHHRHMQRMVAITSVAFIAMLITTGLAIDAVIAGKAAERRQKQAEGLVDFMLGDLHDKLYKVQRLDLIEAVDDKTLAYFKSLPTTDVSSEALVLRVRALTKIGSLRLDQGHLQAAMDSYQAAAKVAAALADAAPSAIPQQVAYAEVLGFIGMTNWREGRFDEAEGAFETARDVLHRVQPRTPGAKDQALLFQLATTYNNIGHVLEVRGRLDAAAQEYRQMLALSLQLVALDPTNTHWSEALGAAHNNVGKLALMSGDLAEAIAEYRADEIIESALSEADSKDNDQRENLLRVRAIVGRTLALAGEVQAGMLDLEQAVAVATQLSKLDESNSTFQEDIALYAAQLSRLRRLSGDLNGANALAGQSIAIFSVLTRQDPANAPWQREYAEVRIEEAALAHAAGNAEDARTKASRALNTLDPLLAKHPEDRATLLAAVSARLLLAEVTENEAAARLSLREDALKAVQSTSSGRDDPRLLALQVQALLALHRRAQAAPIIQRLWSSGYRDPALLSLLDAEKMNYPINKGFNDRLQASLHSAESVNAISH
jgi:tetratricopeptide (TPR) repeat protein